ncbi:hypothetical protein IFO70_14895 [Phormidium tenue FACHB-886]|nr:hypothetical protein [Phormidium tenue FACHB-886]
MALQRWVQNPAAISAIASLGVHAFLFAVLPVLPGAALRGREAEIKEPVNLVELTPEEQSRLPDISTAPPELPPIAQQPLPDEAAPFSLTPLPNQTTPPALPPFLTQTPFMPPPIIFAQPEPVAPARPAVPAAPPAATPKPSTPATPAPEATATPPAASESPTPSPGMTTDNLPFNPSASPDQAAVEQPSPSVDEIRQAQRQAQVDRIRVRREQLAALNPDETGIGDSAVLGNMSTWSDAVGKWLNDDEKFRQLNFKEPIEIAGTYPEAACSLQADRAVWVGVLVNADGKAINETGNRPQLVQGSGYGIFNQQAIEAAAAHTYQPTGEKEAYLVQVNYEYSQESCPAAPAQPRPNNEAQG